MLEKHFANLFPRSPEITPVEINKADSEKAIWAVAVIAVRRYLRKYNYLSVCAAETPENSL